MGSKYHILQRKNRIIVQLSLLTDCIQQNFHIPMQIWYVLYLYFITFISHHNKAIIHEKPWDPMQHYGSSGLSKYTALHAPETSHQLTNTYRVDTMSQEHALCNSKCAQSIRIRDTGIQSITSKSICIPESKTFMSKTFVQESESCVLPQMMLKRDKKLVSSTE